MTSQSVFLAAFFGATIGIVTMIVLRVTLIDPIIRRGKRWLREAMKRTGVTTKDIASKGANVTDCECCACGDVHTAFTDPDGNVIPKD